MSDVLPWLVFAVTAAAVVLGGVQLARQGDRIAEETGIGALWIGAMLLAAATSLPEIVTDVSAALIDEPDLAVGDLFGSSMANMAVLALIDLIHRRRRVWQSVSLGNVLVGVMASALTSLAAVFALQGLGLSIGHVGLETALIAVLYLLGTRAVFRHEYLQARLKIAEREAASRPGASVEPRSVRLPALRSAAAFLVGAALILAAAPFLASSAADIAGQTGIETSFVGVTFLALTTSLPELVTAIAAVRIGAYDLAVGNLFGSNAFNMAALFFVDIAYTPGPVLASVSEAQVVAALAALFLMATGMMGIIYRAERRFFLVEPDAAAVLVGYAAGLLLVYQAGA